MQCSIRATARRRTDLQGRSLDHSNRLPFNAWGAPMAASKRIGNYAVQALIGQGGMGAVYRAEHTVIGRQVAIKILRRELAGQSDQVARFLNEARAPGAANHPGIV